MAGSAPLLGSSASMRAVRRFAERAAAVEAPVLLTGETGTGKSLLARRIHEDGARNGGPFLAVNCAAVAEGIFESEFFGHRRGAFTGALETRKGLFERADGGTLFLDEIGELPPARQSTLLTVLEERTVRRVGGDRAVPFDVRLVAATSRNLLEALRARAFRRDLYHRVAVLRCRLPPLRERPDDVPLLARHFLERLARRHDRPVPALETGALELMVRHSWPGNVRELAHALEAALVLGEGGITPEILSSVLLPGSAPGGAGPARPRPGGVARKAAAPPRAPVPSQVPRGGSSGAGADSARPARSGDTPGSGGSPGSVVPPRAGTGEGSHPAPEDGPTPPGSDDRRARTENGAGSGSGDGAEAGPRRARYSFYGTPEEERALILAALRRTRGNKSRAARELGMARNTLRAKLRRYGL